jgi:hypothetical protein
VKLHDYSEKDSQSATFNPQAAYDLYTAAVQVYSRRSLTVKADILAAFAGIYNAIGTKALGPSLSGLPTAFLGTALCWHSANPVLVRNDSFCSWSWAGWIGPIMMGCGHQTSLAVHSLRTQPSSSHSTGEVASPNRSGEILCFTTQVATCDTGDSVLKFGLNQASLNAARELLYGKGYRKEFLALMYTSMDHETDDRGYHSKDDVVLWLIGQPEGRRAERLAVVHMPHEDWERLPWEMADLEIA